MRLLHTTTRTLHTFTDKKIPKYAILSHTWEENEVTYQDMKLAVAEKMMGYQKVAMACSVSAARGFEYVWLDTCCIDKDSSAELSEAINSMYRWYEGAQECFAYLADVDCVGAVAESQLRGSSWFRRGWTLQELIAPAHVVFFNQKWQPVGTKDNLKHEISRVTGIPVNILSGDDIDTVSTAQIMSWASKRDTTRTEDIAYCLMGLFDVNMPLLYGEGEKAFIRLQEEIMKQSDDYSLFAWRSDSDSNKPSENSGGLLASSPAAFVNSGKVVRLSQFSYLHTLYTPLTISNKGIHLTLPIVQADSNTCFAILNCTEEGRGLHCLALQVEALTLSGEYFMVKSDRLRMLEINGLEGSVKSICVQRERHRKRTARVSPPKRRWDFVHAEAAGRRADRDFVIADNTIRRRFACPYYKHDPTRWKTCRGLERATFRSLRGHVVSKHVSSSFECNRCHEVFENMDILNAHLRAESPCQSKPSIAGGIPRFRKKTLLLLCKFGTDEEKWGKLYQFLFPGETTPSPYFDDNDATATDGSSQEIITLPSSSATSSS
ncbi:heterokaryon incompatibility protein-domain-containing protein [Xylaria arbuscula]|uniref:C2H2-type domain-containing protein n=1 Tax=Xylaria arbuscula TaxID=114810 RepID=A0A9W8NC94_9PEZI|nr:heterokaryon incompatibility protein-domain-containing protein [Xylaria arbuscula]KAJ3567943.1 hypothetical protein NPX13_g6592 [Xylaria arbuscula]